MFLHLHSTLSTSISQVDRKSARITKVQIAEIRMIEVFCQEIFEGV